MLIREIMQVKGAISFNLNLITVRKQKLDRWGKVLAEWLAASNYYQIRGEINFFNTGFFSTLLIFILVHLQKKKKSTKSRIMSASATSEIVEVSAGHAAHPYTAGIIARDLARHYLLTRGQLPCPYQILTHRAELDGLVE